MKIITRKEAQDRGLNKYFTGKPCKYGHVAERYVAKSDCVVCNENRGTKRQQSKYDDIDTQLSFEKLREIILSMKPGNFKSIEKRKPNLLSEIIRHTSFLDHREPKLPERLFCIRNEIHSPVLCEQCGENEVSFNTKHPPYNTYQRFCSTKCSANNNGVRDQKKVTSIERYGTEHPSQAESVKQKAVATNIKRYGVPSILSDNEICKKGMKEKYGVEHTMQHPVLKESAMQKRNAQMDSIMEKVRNTNLKNYGVEWFYQSDYFKSLPHDWKSSKGEREVADWVESLGLKVIRNDQRTVGQELDIYIPEKNIAIEYCGLHWHSDEFKDKKYHKEKFDNCKAQGIQLITLFEDEWHFKKEQVQSRLSSLIGINMSIRVPGRKCTVKQINNKDSKPIMEQYHLQGWARSTVCLGLYFKDELVSVMSFVKRSDNNYELNRFVSKYIVQGGFTKLLKYFCKNYECNKIISFADCRWSWGDVYSNNGFTLESIIKPDYYYTKNLKRSHKFLFRKKSIKNKFGIDMTNKTEREAMKELGYKRIYDCGKYRFVLENNQ